MKCKCAHDKERHSIEVPFPCLDCDCEGFEYSGYQHKTWDDYYANPPEYDRDFDRDEFLSDLQPE